MLVYAIAPESDLTQDEIIEYIKLKLLRKTWIQDSETYPKVMPFNNKTHREFLMFLRKYDPQTIGVYKAWRDSPSATMPPRVLRAYESFVSKSIQIQSTLEDFDLDDEDKDILFGR